MQDLASESRGAMTYYKPILALGSLGAGIAVTFFALHLTSDRFAFTTRIGTTLNGPGSVTLAAPAHATVDHSLFSDPAREIEPQPATRAPSLAPKPQARRSVTQPAITQSSGECNPAWRELESGPAGRRVREIC
jgi:hypothetical protein